MKTTVEIADSLLREAQELARRDKVTLRSLVESGLRHEVAVRSSRGDFALADASVGGNGLSAQFRGATWSEVRDAAYGDRA